MSEPLQGTAQTRSLFGILPPSFSVGISPLPVALRFDLDSDDLKKVGPISCYGHRVVTSIDGFTPPAAVDGQQTTKVDYHYKMMDVPGWSDSDAIRKAFPTFAKATSGNVQDQATLVLTVNGWRFPGT